MKIIKITSLIILIILITTFFNLNRGIDKLKNYFYTQKIEKQNQDVLLKITKEDVITKNDIKILRGLTTNSTEEIKEIPKEKIARNLQTNSLITNLVEKYQQETPKEIETPNQAYLEVDFICQAPLQTESNWTLHEESCEEAALLQTYLYETDKHMTKIEANEEILRMIDWQNKNMGGHHDLDADEMKIFISEYYNLNKDQIEIIYDASIYDLKKAIAMGHPVIVPITGEILNNPYYPYPGYHMLTVIGFTELEIITNDNGTRRGQDFSYSIPTFEAAMNDAGADIIILNINS